jgi:hypothetical protein
MKQARTIRIYGSPSPEHWLRSYSTSIRNECEPGELSFRRETEPVGMPEREQALEQARVLVQGQALVSGQPAARRRALLRESPRPQAARQPQL